MVLQLLPASAKAFAERTKPKVVLNARAETWLTQTLKRVNKAKRPLNNVSQHQACLEDTLSGDNAIWSLAAMMVPNAPEADLMDDDNEFVAAVANHQLISIEGYVVHIDMVSQHEVGFKLTQDTIDSLIEYHKKVWSVNNAANEKREWPEKDRAVKKMQDDFVQAVNRYVFRTSDRALEGLEDEGAGELLEGRSLEVKTGIEQLFLSIQPPPPPVQDVFPASHYATGQYWVPCYGFAPMLHQPMPQQIPQQQYRLLVQPAQPMQPVEPWTVLGSSPSPPSSHSEPHLTEWSLSPYAESYQPSPTPSYVQPFTCSPQYSSMSALAPPVQPLPLPSQLLSQHCGVSVGSGYESFWGGGYNDMMSGLPISI